jgi:hypothetical protein
MDQRRVTPSAAQLPLVVDELQRQRCRSALAGDAPVGLELCALLVAKLDDPAIGGGLVLLHGVLLLPAASAGVVAA